MRQEVYTKFAEALQRKQAEQAAATRHQEVVAKFAEALDRQMLQKRADAIYCEGFCKAAELAGVDPEALVKQAGGLGMLGKGFALAKNVAGRAGAAYSRGASAATAAGSGIAGEVAGGLKAVGRGAYNNMASMAGNAAQAVGDRGRRYWELMRGGNAEAMKEITDRSMREGASLTRHNAGFIDRMRARMRSYARGLNGEFSRKANNAANAKLESAIAADRTASRGFADGILNQAAAYEQQANGYRRGESEMRKVLGARLGTAGVLGAGAYGVGSSVSGD